ncbi:uncharacterized protein MG328 [Pararge aegeria]|uniref:uncharacterized protein MG328 n=1 Tax=Pararge aegeria TaxID=116150 RepID=UPI0019D058A0|nr:uncharacterized protein MG328 [Pararge aegeria]
MASEDVIELGSSDDEAEPVPKKKKPMLNAMVVIPKKLHGITIKPSKPVPPINVGGLAKPVLIKQRATAIDQRRLVSTTTIPFLKRVQNTIETVTPPILQNQLSINPVSLVKSLHRRQVVVKKVPKLDQKVKKVSNVKIGSTQKKESKCNPLPSSLTITPVNNRDIKIQSLENAGTSGLHNKLRIVPLKKNLSGELTTVELDDEDTYETGTASPQWYLRPEDQAKHVQSEGKDNDKASMEVDSVPSMEDKNNKEPDITKYVEITIEDSPLKPVNSKHPDIGKELTITIEDSPVKPVSKPTRKNESDNEINEVVEDKQSKKKLDYPKVSKNSQENHVVEIEIDLFDTSSLAESENKSVPALPQHKCTTETEKSHEPTGEDKVTKGKEIVSEDDEFHPTYQKFIQMCFQLENTEDMKKIVEKKIKAYYRQCPKEYVESEEFIDMVSSKIVTMKASPEKMYLYIKDIVDELNLQRKITKSLVSSMKMVDSDKESSDVKHVVSQCDNKKRRQIRKLEKTIKKLHRAIQKLEEQEVDFDDDEDSVYLLTERYKERMVRVHAKFCQLTNTKMPSEPRLHIEARPGRPAGPAKKLEKWINRKVSIGTPLPFPDFHDVLRCVRDANEEEKLCWNEVDIMEEARDLFTRCGKKLQRRRQENEWRIAASRITSEVDPALDNSDLKKKLDDNKTIAAKKETELFNKYVDRQNLLKLEAVEIGDKEAEESPLESEEDDVIENDNSLENKQNRKQRLKRLLQEKSKKEDDKENIAREDPDEKEKENNNETDGEKPKENDQEKNVNGIETTDDKSDDVVLFAESSPNEAQKFKEKDKEIDNTKENKKDENDDSDAYKVESDIDELHLLQKLHSENEVNSSSLESSDSDTPIAISDTLESDSEAENEGKPYDVISIENSSYSESEMIIDGSSKESDTNSISKYKFDKLVTASIEIEYSSTGLEETNKEAPAAKNTAVKQVEENIFLASSDEEAKDNADNMEIEDTCINLKDDNISITETTIHGGTVEDGNLSNDERIITENNNALETLEGNPSSEENDVNEIKEDSNECTESMDITESSNEPSEATIDFSESASQIKVHTEENKINDQLATTVTNIRKTIMEI